MDRVMVVHPGVYIAQELAKRGWMQADLAEILNCTAVSDMVNGRRGISYAMALKLEAAFPDGPNAYTWAQRQSAHDLSRARAPKPGIAERAAAVTARRSAS